MLASGSTAGAVVRAWLSHASTHAVYRTSKRPTAERWVAIRGASGQVNQTTAAAYRTRMPPARTMRRALDRGAREEPPSAWSRTVRWHASSRPRRETSHAGSCLPRRPDAEDAALERPRTLEHESRLRGERLPAVGRSETARPSSNRRARWAARTAGGAAGSSKRVRARRDTSEPSGRLRRDAYARPLLARVPAFVHSGGRPAVAWSRCGSSAAPARAYAASPSSRSSFWRTSDGSTTGFAR